jgi:hypothetical protein
MRKEKSMEYIVIAAVVAVVAFVVWKGRKSIATKLSIGGGSKDAGQKNAQQ